MLRNLCDRLSSRFSTPTPPELRGPVRPLRGRGFPPNRDCAFARSVPAPGTPATILTAPFGRDTACTVSRQLGTTEIAAGRAEMVLGTTAEGGGVSRANTSLPVPAFGEPSLSSALPSPVTRLYAVDANARR